MGVESETHGLTKLDLVKHAMRTIIASLHDKDRLAIVEFNSVARTLFELQPTEAAGKARALAAVEALRPGGETNLWAGLKAGLDLVVGAAHPGARSGAATVFLLTDGMPTITPPRGELPMFQR